MNERVELSITPSALAALIVDTVYQIVEWSKEPHMRDQVEFEGEIAEKLTLLPDGENAQPSEDGVLMKVVPLNRVPSIIELGEFEKALLLEDDILVAEQVANEAGFSFVMDVHWRSYVDHELLHKLRRGWQPPDGPYLHRLHASSFCVVLERLPIEPTLLALPDTKTGRPTLVTVK